MISSVSGIGSYIGQMDIQAMQQHRDHMFSKIDSNSDGGIDKSEFSTFAEKISERTGNSIEVESVFSKYDVDGTGVLSKGEIDAFMEDHAPHPLAQMQKAMPAYVASKGADRTDQISSLIDLLNNQSADDGSDQTNLISAYLLKVLESLNSGTSSQDTNSLFSTTA